MLHSLNHPLGSAQSSLKQFPVLPELRGPELDAIFQMWSHQGRVEGEENLSRPTNHTASDTPQGATGLLDHKGTVLAHYHPAAHQDPQYIRRTASSFRHLHYHHTKLKEQHKNNSFKTEHGKELPRECCVQPACWANGKGSFIKLNFPSLCYASQCSRTPRIRNQLLYPQSKSSKECPIPATSDSPQSKTGIQIREKELGPTWQNMIIWLTELYWELDWEHTFTL